MIILITGKPRVGKTALNTFFAKWSYHRYGSYRYKRSVLEINADNENRINKLAIPYKAPIFTNYDKRLLDVLEPKVAERYYLKGKVVLSLIEHKKKQEAKGNTFGWKPQKIGGGQPELLRPKVAGVQVQTLSLKNKATEFERLTETSSALCARDYKGYGNQQATAIMEIYE